MRTVAYGRSVSRAVTAPARVSRVRLFRALGTVAVLVLVAVVLAVSRATGGAPSPLNHLAYLPIVFAAYLFGTKGGLLTALLLALFLGPLPWSLSDTSVVVNAEVGMVRALMYITVGATTGVLFDRVRHALIGWQSAAIEIAKRERDGMVALARGAEAKDTDTGDHVVRVQLVAERLALATGMDAVEAADLGWSAMLHDVGKLHVPDQILLKPGELAPDEWDVMRRHPIWGEHILEHGSGFELARRIARWHHENMDGSGYPDGLRGSAIPFEARIVRIADAFDAMTHDRPYHRARTLAWALEELERHAGTMFDPELVRLFTDLLRRDPALARRLLAPSLREELGLERLAAGAVVLPTTGI